MVIQAFPIRFTYLDTVWHLLPSVLYKVFATMFGATGFEFSRPVSRLRSRHGYPHRAVRACLQQAFVTGSVARTTS